MLEMSRPLNYVSAQLLHFLQPIVTLSTTAGEYQAFTDFLEQRGSIEYISRRLEVLNQSDANNRKGQQGANADDRSR